MTGFDVYDWFSDLWYDLMHLGSASLPEVGFKLAVLFFGFLIAKAILGMVWRVLYVETLRPILEPVFKVVFFPFRLPFLLGRSIKRKYEEKSRARKNAADEQRRSIEGQRCRAEQEAAKQRREQERIAEMIRLQNQARIR